MRNCWKNSHASCKVFKHFKTVQEMLGILEWDLLQVVMGRITELIMPPESRWHALFPKRNATSDISCRIIFARWLVLKHSKIVWEHWEIFGWGFLHVVTRSITKIKIYHMTTDLQSSPKKNETFKSCVSFEEECRIAFVEKLGMFMSCFYSYKYVYSVTL